MTSRNDVTGFYSFLYNKKQQALRNNVTNEVTFWKICLFTSLSSLFPNYIVTVPVYAKT